VPEKFWPSVVRTVNFDFVAAQLGGSATGVQVRQQSGGSIVGGFIPLAPFPATGPNAGLFNLYTDGAFLRLNYFTDAAPAAGQNAITSLVIPGFGTFSAAAATYHYDAVGKYADWQWPLTTKFVIGQQYSVRVIADIGPVTVTIPPLNAQNEYVFTIPVPGYSAPFEVHLQQGAGGYVDLDIHGTGTQPPQITAVTLGGTRVGALGPSNLDPLRMLLPAGAVPAVTAGQSLTVSIHF
jgi:hypothetical protein